MTLGGIKEKIRSLLLRGIWRRRDWAMGYRKSKAAAADDVDDDKLH